MVNYLRMYLGRYVHRRRVLLRICWLSLETWFFRLFSFCRIWRWKLWEDHCCFCRINLLRRWSHDCILFCWGESSDLSRHCLWEVADNTIRIVDQKAEIALGSVPWVRIFAARTGSSGNIAEGKSVWLFEGLLETVSRTTLFFPKIRDRKERRNSGR